MNSEKQFKVYNYKDYDFIILKTNNGMYKVCVDFRDFALKNKKSYVENTLKDSTLREFTLAGQWLIYNTYSENNMYGISSAFYTFNEDEQYELVKGKTEKIIDCKIANS